MCDESESGKGTKNSQNDTRPTQEKAHPKARAASLFAGFFLNLLFSLFLAGRNTADGREEFCVGSSGPHMEAIESAFSFPAAVATVERQEILVVEMHLDFVKVCA